ncbi:hypothetical protein M885DRAFT_533210 [Pelagophyceae sp. CCMP2097]|nr:hypothetical protein M885DRAFT_533210 [Pelagophyceae sp. CCMP2097]
MRFPAAWWLLLAARARGLQPARVNRWPSIESSRRCLRRPGAAVAVSARRTNDAAPDAEPSGDAEDAASGDAAPSLGSKGALYVAIWASIYFPILIFFDFALEHDLLHSSQFGLDAPKALCTACDWLDAHWAKAASVTSTLRNNDRAANFAAAYFLADWVPTSFIALGLYPAVKARIDGRATDTDEPTR